MKCIRRPRSTWTTCPCPPCRAHAARMAKLARNGAYHRVPSEVAWAEIDRLRHLGWSSRAIATSAGLLPASMETALQERKRGRLPHLGAATAAAIVAHGDPTDGLVGATGTRRRLQALARQGWDLQRLADMSGIGFSTLAAIRGERTNSVRAVFYVTIRELANELTARIGPSTQARNHAKAHQWPGLLAWDAIDDPDEKPRGVRTADTSRDDIDPITVERVLLGENLPTTTAERREITRRWIASGGSEAALCRRLGWRSGRYKEAS